MLLLMPVAHAANHAAQTGPTPPSVVTIPQIATPLHLSDFAGMRPGPSIASTLLRIDHFTQRDPQDGVPPTEETEAYLGYTPSTLYVVFICHDRQPKSIRGHLARRENITADDNVSILLDPFQDHRKGVLFQVNPAGVQADASWDDGNNTDYSYDQVWDSEGRVTPDGWMAMMAIPFRSLRFRPESTSWGFILMRSLPRNSEDDYWPRIARSVSGFLTQEATLEGIHGVTGSRNLQLNPYAIAQNIHTLNTVDPTNPYFSTRNFESTAGGDAKLILHDSLVVDATINPDFSQVESDQPQFTINQRYPVYFPELRPFFLENANYFSTPINLVYTRNIVRPEYGARLTGKIHHTNVGLLFADDTHEGLTYDPGDTHYGKRGYFLAARGSQDIGKSSLVGVAYTDHEFAGSFNRVGGVDFKAHLNDSWNAFGQIVESSTLDPDGNYSAGPASYLELNRSGNSFNFDDSYSDVSKGYVTTLGFLQTTNIRINNNYMHYYWHPKHSHLQLFGPEVNSNVAFDHDGNRVYHYFNFDFPFGLPRNTVLAPVVGENSDTLQPSQYSTLTRNKNLTENFAGIIVRSAPLPQFSVNIFFTHGGNPNYNPPANTDPFLLHEEYMQARATIQPVSQITIDNTYLLDRNHAAATGVFVFENQVMRTKVNYQFTRALSARVIVEYDSLLANPSQTSLVRTKEVSPSVLLTWLPHPGTAIYAGYTGDVQNLDRDFCTRSPGPYCNSNDPILPRASGYLQDHRQFFVKASYLYRF